MNIVTFPYIAQTYKLALQEVLYGYFRDGGSFNIMGDTLEVYRVKLTFQIEQIDKPTDRPIMAITGSRGEEVNTFLCQDDSRRVIEIADLELPRMVFVSIPKNGPIDSPPYTPPNKELPTYETVDKVWGQLAAVLNAETANWKLRNIRSIYLEPTPQEVVHNDYWIGRGLLRAHLQVPRPRP